MTAERVTAFLYAALAVVFTYESRALDDEAFAWAYIGTAVAVQVVTGFLSPRLWLFALPFVAFVVSLRSPSPSRPGPDSPTPE